MNTTIKIIFALVLCLTLLLSGCGASSSKVTIDYGDAESFEAALNAGDNLEGKIVQFVVKEFHPDSALGYNLWAGEHLNFISSRNPDIKEGDTATVKATTIENQLGSWIIKYEKVSDAVIGENTITSENAGKTDANTSSVSTGEKQDASIAEKPVEEKKEDPAPTEPAPTESAPEVTESSVPAGSAEEAPQNTYEHNEYYDVIETANFKDSIGYSHVIHKVLAKKNVSISATVIAYDANGSVIGKSSDDIVLTEGKTNYFEYGFEADVSGASFQLSAQAQSDSFMTGQRNGVEMVDYNLSGDDLYITFKQTVDELSHFAKFKLLFYNGDQIVDTEYSYFSTSAKNLNGKDSTDVASIWVFGKTFDRFEYIFEP